MHLYVHSAFLSAACLVPYVTFFLVDIYDQKNDLVRTFNVPVGGGPSTIWHVFSINVDGIPTIIPVNEMHNVLTTPEGL